MTTASEYIAKEASYIGVSGTDNIFNTWYYGEHVYDPYTYPWCAAFQSYVAVHDLKMGITPSASAAGVANQGTRVDDSQVKPGDWVLFNWDGRTDTGWADHIGLVEWFDHSSGYFGTIEGNTGGGEGSVMRVTRYNYSNYFTAFFRPPYDGKEQKSSAPAQPRYRVWRSGGWRPWTSVGRSAGKKGYPIYDVDFSVLPKGSWFRLTLKGGKVLGKNKQNTAHKVPVSGLEVFYNTAKPKKTGYWEAVYRVHTLDGSWLKWEHDVEDGGAGDDRNAIDVVQFKIVKC